MDAAKSDKARASSEALGFAPEVRPSSLRMVQQGEVSRRAEAQQTADRVMQLLVDGMSVAAFIPDEKFIAGWAGGGVFETRVLTVDMKLTFLKLFPPRLEEL